MTRDRCISGDAQERTVTEPPSSKEGGPCSRQSCCSDFIRQLIHREIQADRARAAAEEAEQWERCFGATAPSNWKARQRRIVRVASSRAFLGLLNRPNSQPPPSFDDFFPNET
jgi:hypothetical protein